MGARYWRKGRKIYEEQDKYTDEPLGELRVIKDFLPSPDQLVLKEENVKITIALKKSSIEILQGRSKETSHFLSKDDKTSHRLVRITL